MASLGRSLFSPRRPGMSQADEPQLRVIGVGYGRTGTDSLRAALNTLGFRTFRTKEMFESDQLFSHFDDAVFRFDLPQLRQPDLGIVARSGFERDDGHADEPVLQAALCAIPRREVHSVRAKISRSVAAVLVLIDRQRQPAPALCSLSAEGAHD